MSWGSEPRDRGVVDNAKLVLQGRTTPVRVRVRGAGSQEHNAWMQDAMYLSRRLSHRGLGEYLLRIRTYSVSPKLRTVTLVVTSLTPES